MAIIPTPYCDAAGQAPALALAVERLSAAGPLAENRLALQAEFFNALLDARSSGMIDATCRDGSTAMFIAVEVNESFCVEHLLRAGASATTYTAQGTSALHLCARTGHLEILDCLLRVGLDVNHVTRDLCTPLYIAASYGNARAVEALIAAGANLESRSADGFTPMLAAASHGHAATVDVLLCAGADPMALGIADGSTALWVASQQGHADVVKLICTKCVNPGTDQLGMLEHTVRLSTQRYGAVDLNALEAAALRGHAGVVQCLRAAGAVVFDICRLQLLRDSATEGFSQIIAWLENSRHWGPLHFACHFRDSELIVQLLREGADPKEKVAAQDARCSTPHRIASSAEYALARPIDALTLRVLDLTACPWNPRNHYLQPSRERSLGRSCLLLAHRIPIAPSFVPGQDNVWFKHIMPFVLSRPTRPSAAASGEA